MGQLLDLSSFSRGTLLKTALQQPDDEADLKQ
jgi:hypothetical protein